MAPGIPKTMYAWRKHKGNPEAVYEEVPVPTTPPDGFLVRILAVGVCHSDVGLVAVDSNEPWFQEKFTLGHEGCGEIVDLGEAVKETKFKLGDRVAINPVPGCGQADCPECSNNHPQLCVRIHYGLGQDGSFADYIAISARAAILVPDGVQTWEAAVSTDAIMTSHHAIVRRGQVRPSDTVFLFGLGGLGFNALQILRHIGCRVLISDTRQGPLDEAAKLGVPSKDIVPINTDVLKFVTENELENKIDIVFDFVGVQQTFENAQSIVRRGGKIVVIGLLASELQVHHVQCILKALTMVWCFGGTSADIVDGMNLIAKGKLTARVETAPLKNFAKVLLDLHEGKVKSRMVLLPESVLLDEK